MWPCFLTSILRGTLFLLVSWPLDVACLLGRLTSCSSSSSLSSLFPISSTSSCCGESATASSSLGVPAPSTGRTGDFSTYVNLVRFQLGCFCSSFSFGGVALDALLLSFFVFSLAFCPPPPPVPMLPEVESLVPCVVFFPSGATAGANASSCVRVCCLLVASLRATGANAFGC